jgi:hypothetical protein
MASADSAARDAKNTKAGGKIQGAEDKGSAIFIIMMAHFASRA